MSVQNLKSPDEWTRLTFEGRAASCFYCSEDVTEVAIVWNGFPSRATDCGLIVCHPDCAVILAIELMGDARNAQRLLTGRPLTAGICSSLIPQGKA